MTRSLSALAVVVALVTVGRADDPPKPPGPAIAFPDVDGFTRDKPTIFPKAELGYSVPYNAKGIAVTVYVYHGGRKVIPPGAKSDAVKEEMKGTIAALEQARKAGYYTTVKEVGKEEVVSLGKGKAAPTALRRKFEVESPKSGAAISETYLLGYKDHFVKFRISYSPENATEAEKKIATLLEALGAALK